MFCSEADVFDLAQTVHGLIYGSVIQQKLHAVRTARAPLQPRDTDGPRRGLEVSGRVQARLEKGPERQCVHRPDTSVLSEQ
jgi:hypothetical protein